MEIAAGIEPPEDVCRRYQVSLEEFSALQRDDVFRKAVVDYQLALRESGRILQIKAQLILEANIDALGRVIAHSDDSKAVLDAWKAVNEILPKPAKGKTAPTDPQQPKRQVMLWKGDEDELVEVDDAGDHMPRKLTDWSPDDDE